jgi:hypothetical protein
LGKKTDEGLVETARRLYLGPMRRTAWKLFAGSVLGALAFAAPAGATTFIVEGEHVDTAAADKAQGLVLDATGEPDCWVPDYCAVNDHGLGAKGLVVGHGPFPGECGSVYHYHQQLLGKEDPDPHGCGWGGVVPYSDESLDVQDAAQAITHETRAQRDDDPARAADHTQTALEALSALEATGDLDTTQGSLIADAKALDEKAKSLFERASTASGENRDLKIRKARRKLKAGLVDKHTVFAQLID